jgi:hypothetical protein
VIKLRQPQGIKRRKLNHDDPCSAYVIYRAESGETIGESRRGSGGWEFRAAGSDEWILSVGESPHTRAIYWLDGDERFAALDGVLTGPTVAELLGHAAIDEDAVPIGPVLPPAPDRIPASVQEAVETASWTAVQNAGGQGYSVDQVAKLAVEAQAMLAAKDYYLSQGWEVDDSVHKNSPFDLECMRNGEVKHVEVKGTTTEGNDVFLTPNEVKHARQCHADKQCQSVALFVVSQVKVQPGAAGELQASGGLPRRLDPWILIDDQLEPTGYRHTLSMITASSSPPPLQ